MPLFPNAPSAARKILIVVDQRGEQFGNMPGDEYAARVVGSVEALASYDTVLLSSPDTKSGTIIKDRGGDTELFTMEIVEAAGHAPADEALVELKRVEDWLMSIGEHRLAELLLEQFSE